MLQRWLVLPGIVFPSIAESLAIAGNLRRLQSGRAHAKGLQNLFLKVVFVARARSLGHYLPENRESKVRVLICDSRNIRKRNSGANPRVHRFVAAGELLIAPGVVFRKALGVCQ